jgi:hypothetical protein
VRGSEICQHKGSEVLEMSGYDQHNVNLCLNVVIYDKPKVLIGLNQNGKRSGMALCEWVIVDRVPPAKRRDPTRSEIQAEQGKPVVLPEAAGDPQGELLVLRVWD